jgi:hypothetical protein
MLEIADLKRQHSVVYCTEIENLKVLFRPLTKREFYSYLQISVMGLVLPGKLENHIFREIVLDPATIDMMMDLPAGLISSIVGVAYKLSGNPLSTEDEVHRFNNDIAQARASLESDVYDQFTTVICKAFPSYSPDDVEEFPYPKFLKLLVMAEQILQLDPINLKPKQEKKSFTGSLFEDAKRAAQVDRPGGPKNLNIKDELEAQREVDRSTAMARKIETMKRVQERRGR